MRKAAIILPTYNEVKNITRVIEGIYSVTQKIPNWDIHIIVVDSDSPDNTADTVHSLQKTYKNLHLLKSQKNGLGKAYIDGFEHAIATLRPYVLFEMDADLSHDPRKIPEFLAKIEAGADFVIGSRYIKGGSIPKDWAFHRKLFSVLGNVIIRLGFMKMSISDWTSGYRAVKVWLIQKALPNLDDYTGYVFQVALLDNAIKEKAHISEVPINFVDRTQGNSKINSFQYILHTLYYVFVNSSFIKFCIVGGIGFIVDFGISYVFINIMHSRIWLSTMISAECAIVSNFLFNNFWSFSHKKLVSHLSFIGSFLKFNFISAGSIAIQTIGIQLAVNAFGRDLWFVYKFVIIMFVIIPYSYILYNKFIWKDSA